MITLVVPSPSPVVVVAAYGRKVATSIALPVIRLVAALAALMPQLATGSKSHCVATRPAVVEQLEGPSAGFAIEVAVLVFAVICLVLGCACVCLRVQRGGLVRLWRGSRRGKGGCRAEPM